MAVLVGAGVNQAMQGKALPGLKQLHDLWWQALYTDCFLCLFTHAVSVPFNLGMRGP